MTEQQEASEDAVMTRIGQAVILLHAGDREEARNRLGAIWSEIGEDGDSLHRCTLAHYMADAQDDPADELAWDLRALTAAEGLTAAGPAADGPTTDGPTTDGPTTDGPPDDGPATGGARADGVVDRPGDAVPARRAGDGPGRPGPQRAVRVFYPSLHLSLAADYVKLRRPEAARVHLARARAATGALSDDGYGNGVRAAIARLERRLAGEPGTPRRPFPEQSP
ncbi:hypothetical protein [Streptomyces sp. NPDC058623]|uniref:hypothetical protein n=1 Tax=Streptomyces sp. NPDC058623 TaxID=3346563 RepID=UPI0036485BD3